MHLWCTEFVHAHFGLKRSKQPASATPKVCSLQMASGINSTGAFCIFVSCDMRFLHLFPDLFFHAAQLNVVLFYICVACQLLETRDSSYIIFQQTVSLCKVSCASMVGKPDLFRSDFASHCFRYLGGQCCAAWWRRMLLLPVALPHWRHYLFHCLQICECWSMQRVCPVPGFWFLLCWCWLWVSRRHK